MLKEMERFKEQGKDVAKIKVDKVAVTGHYYLGSAKNLGQIGKAFAETLHGMNSRRAR